MVYLLKYEWQKFIRTKKNWLVFLLILCSFIGYVSFNGYQNHVYINDNLNMYINDHLRMYTSDYALI